MLRGSIIWMPMLGTDNLNAAERREVLFSDSRVRHYWDPKKILGQMLSRTLHLKTSIAWDVYLVYPVEHSWTTDLPPAPEFWMHQLDEEQKRLLDPPRLIRTVQTMIDGVKYQ